MESISIIQPEELRVLVGESVKKALKETLPSVIREATDSPFMTKSDLMRLTGWSSRTVEYRKAKGDIPFIRRNRTVLFPRDEIVSWLEEGRVSARSEAR